MKNRVFPADMEYWEDVVGFLELCLEPVNVPEMFKDEVMMALEETFTNIASYAYEAETGNVEITCGMSGEDTDEFMISLKDWGTPYNPLKRPDPDFSIPFEEREIGGLGIYMVKKYMDRVEYRYEDDCNILTIGKKL